MPATRRRYLTRKMIERGITHPGLPFPRALSMRWIREAEAVSSWTHKEKRAALDEVARAGFQAQLDGALVCPVRWVYAESSWRCLNCGLVDRYERIESAWVWLQVDGDPDDARETWSETTGEVASRRCLNCQYDDNFEEIPHPPRCRPDWSINLDGTTNQAESILTAGRNSVR